MLNRLVTREIPTGVIFLAGAEDNADNYSFFSLSPGNDSGRDG